jgi:chromosome segregation ATPase
LVQSILFFVLGVLACGFVVTLFAPAALRRAGRLTRRRIEATLPLTRSEIQAEKDGMRAEFAMATRRLEMEIQALREKAAAQMIEIQRGEQAAGQARLQQEAKEAALAESAARNSDLLAELGQRESQLQQLAQNLAEAEKMVQAGAGELEKLGRMYDEASFSSSNRQIELVARESELEQLSQDLAALRAERKEIDKRRQEAQSESRAAREAAMAERKRSADLDKKLERLLATLADREDKLDRRERELARLREQQKGAVVSDNAAAQDVAPTHAGDVAMREEMQKLAAKVVDLVIRLEGPDSPAARAIRPRSAEAESSASFPVSLAERVRTLQKAPG